MERPSTGPLKLFVVALAAGVAFSYVLLADDETALREIGPPPVELSLGTETPVPPAPRTAEPVSPERAAGEESTASPLNSWQLSLVGVYDPPIRVGPSGEILAPDPPAEPRPERVASQPEPAPTPMVRDGWIQLGATRSIAEADRTASRIKAAFPRIFVDGTSTRVSRADLGSRGIYFRIQAGPFAGAPGAREACAELRKAGRECFIVRSES